ncbi:type III-B CRISPR module-associated protein Cmr5 [Porphyromonas circumdentaria]|uniref:type III-B CRISPR module-associated protein Cmr5 n=1 Tax=Porphyromonas circumdentaria TaxID=29524 RepID=UPI0026DC7350|nr:type III-B CRISPR module-associated protein Cmr5 [Porphyromonas circumdentaria]MDO4722885.1 type III-B CRISPR module-associated protein Cmr5 [Porphyromonas circumdentaria]
MNKKVIQNLIPKAMQAIEGVGIVGKDKKFEKVHEGYINALGPTIIQSGLLPTLIFYNKEKRTLWLRALYYMAVDGEEKMTNNSPTAIIELVIDKKGGSIKDLGGKAKEWERKILEYAVALKLALRTFVAEEPETSNTEQQKGGAQ